MAMETRSGAAIVADVEPVVVTDTAETVTEPCLIAVSRPLEVMVATVESDVVHATLVKAFVEPSE